MPAGAESPPALESLRKKLLDVFFVEFEFIKRHSSKPGEWPAVVKSGQLTHS